MSEGVVADFCAALDSLGGMWPLLVQCLQLRVCLQFRPLVEAEVLRGLELKSSF